MVCYFSVAGCRPRNVHCLTGGCTTDCIGSGLVEFRRAVQRRSVLNASNVLTIGVLDTGVNGTGALAGSISIGRIDVRRKSVICIIPKIRRIGSDGIDIRTLQTSRYQLTEMATALVKMLMNRISNRSLSEITAITLMLLNQPRTNLMVHIRSLIPSTGIGNRLTGLNTVHRITVLITLRTKRTSVSTNPPTPRTRRIEPVAGAVSRGGKRTTGRYHSRSQGSRRRNQCDSGLPHPFKNGVLDFPGSFTQWITHRLTPLEVCIVVFTYIRFSTINLRKNGIFL